MVYSTRCAVYNSSYISTTIRSCSGTSATRLLKYLVSSVPPCTVIPIESFQREEIEGKTSKLLNFLYNDELVSCHKKAVVIKLEEYRLSCLSIFTKESCSTTNFTKAKEDSLDVLCDPNATYSSKKLRAKER